MNEPNVVPVESTKFGPPKTGPILQLAGLVVILVGVHLAAPVAVPILAALVITVAASGLTRLGEHHLPPRVSAWIALIATLAMVAGFGALLFAATADVVASLPQYQREWAALKKDIILLFSQARLYGMARSLQQLNVELHLSAWIVNALQGTLKLLSGVLIVSILSGFLMLESSVFSAKVERIRELTGVDIAAILSGRLRLQRYLGIKTAISGATGLAAGLACWLFELPHPGLFGLGAFVLNYIPTLGSIIAGIPPVALALLVLDWKNALGLAVSYLAINLLIGNVLEPRWMSRSSQLSPAAVIVSMMFWGLVLGPVGALVSVPLTMMVRILAESSQRYGWLAVLLEPPVQTHRNSVESQRGRRRHSTSVGGDRPISEAREGGRRGPA